VSSMYRDRIAVGPSCPAAGVSHCILTGIGGVTSFTGAIVDGADLATLAYCLASALGIQIEGDD
jgi:hypothetical protein